ncbi:short-chain dehydrogenase [Pigmentiphaga sp. NML080357]|uniref:SDR family NAD(P)-dependent oxidoreductase n=1 Tax=Pigmentiphaga sp. NML080357 TaxID=2008675 RepID=UPI000B410359|nr:SDR family NAD(P)-dependent oxidoreductase [Pigmentiphaga sp. NML080357]OVZ55074.1 short-chain dehydrogenase [Pigmentiphaga sp. NML080357]
MNDSITPRPLDGSIALVTGGSRGVGKGVALALGEAGATVYVTGRTLARGGSQWPGSLEETIDEIERRGGRAIGVVCDHADDGSVKQAIDRVLDEQDGRIDVLVNNVFAAPAQMPVNKPFWELDDDIWEMLMRVGLRSHYVTSRLVAPHMVARKRGLIVNTSSGGAVRYTFNVPFGVQKAGVNKLALDMAHDLRPFNVASVVIWPGFIKSEKFLAQPDRVPEALAKRILEHGESAEFAGRAVAALAADVNVMQKSGQLLLVAELAKEYGFTDVDGRVPTAPARQ